jgi:hypothetical protein
VGRTQFFSGISNSRLVCPLPSKTDEGMDQVKELLKNRIITIHQVADMLGMSFGSVQSTLKDNLNMHQISAKFVPCLLNEGQKENHVKTCQDFQEWHKRDAELLDSSSKIM